MKLKIITTDLNAGKLLALAEKEAARCFTTAAYYQAIQKKRHLFERWNDRAQEWQRIIMDIEQAALNQE